MSTKKSWKTRRLDWLYPSAPLRETALESIRQLVIESAAGSVIRARPFASVMSCGCQNSVSGKYSRIRAGSAGDSPFDGVVVSAFISGAGSGFGTGTALGLTDSSIGGGGGGSVTMGTGPGAARTMASGECLTEEVLKIISISSPVRTMQMSNVTPETFAEASAWTIRTRTKPPNARPPRASEP